MKHLRRANARSRHSTACSRRPHRPSGTPCERVGRMVSCTDGAGIHGSSGAPLGRAGPSSGTPATKPITTYHLTDALRDAELLADAVTRVSAGTPESVAFAEYESTRDRLSSALADVTEAVCRYDWSEDEIQVLLTGRAAP